VPFTSPPPSSALHCTPLPSSYCGGLGSPEDWENEEASQQAALTLRRRLDRGVLLGGMPGSSDLSQYSRDIEQSLMQSQTQADEMLGRQS